MKPEDIVICAGDVFIGKPGGWDEIRKQLPGTWWLIRGNHDRRSCSWWCDHGFAFAADAVIFRGAWITHKPSAFLPPGCNINIHGHLHNIWDGFHPNDPAKDDDDFVISKRGTLKYSWQRLFSVEYTKYAPVEFDKFVAHPDRYNSRGPNGAGH